MASATFAKALPRVLVHEGGYSNHRSDPGGVTLQGITQRVYDADRARRGLPKRALKPVMLNTAEWIAERNAIYRRQYWDVIRADQLPSGVDYVVFDGAVNSGPMQSVKWLQRALGVRADGFVGQVTLDAVERNRDHDKLVASICAQRMAFLRALSTWGVFGKGWSSRVANVKSVGQAMASGSVGPEPVFVAEAAAKANVEDARHAPATAIADLSTGSGIATGGFAGTLQQAQDSLAPLAGISEHIATIVTVLTIAGVVLTVGGLVYGWYARRKRAQLIEALA